jgi:putative transposase
MEISPYIVMPDHFHGVFRINDTDDCKGGSRPALTEKLKIKPLGQLIGAFKTMSAKQINLLRSTPGTPVWHRNYYDHIIRGDDEFRRICDYIDTNPQNWDQDRLHPSK